MRWTEVSYNFGINISLDLVIDKAFVLLVLLFLCMNVNTEENTIENKAVLKQKSVSHYLCSLDSHGLI